MVLDSLFSTTLLSNSTFCLVVISWPLPGTLPFAAGAWSCCMELAPVTIGTARQANNNQPREWRQRIRWICSHCGWSARASKEGWCYVDVIYELSRVLLTQLLRSCWRLPGRPLACLFLSCRFAGLAEQQLTQTAKTPPAVRPGTRWPGSAETLIKDYRLGSSGTLIKVLWIFLHSLLALWAFLRHWLQPQGWLRMAAKLLVLVGRSCHERKHAKGQYQWLL